MRQRRYAAGKTIYREGEEADAVYFIESGEVAVSRDSDNGSLLLGHLGRGNILGETSVVQDRAHSTNAHARTDVTLLEVRREDFIASFTQGNPIALSLLRMLCARLSEADRCLMEHLRAPRGAAPAESGRVRLLPASPKVEKQIGPEGVEIERLPFVVGRRAMPGQPPNVTGDEVALVADDFSMLSMEHFAIEKSHGWLVVRDLDSEIGTTVNGVRLTPHEPPSTAPLVYGENTVTAGDPDSPFAFSVRVDID